MLNTSWRVGDGRKINLWLDSWCGNSLANIYSIPPQTLQTLPVYVSNFIDNHQWKILEELNQTYPNLRNLAAQVILPKHNTADKLVWQHTNNGELTLKDAYSFKNNSYPKLNWAKNIWSKDIPPSRSLLVWRIMWDKLQKDENLSSKGCCLPSMCSLYGSKAETTFHLFFECIYAVNLWCWLAAILNTPIHFQSIEDI